MEYTATTVLDDDRPLTLEAINNKCRGSIKTQLVQLQSHFTNELRSLKWAQALTCMKIQQKRHHPSKGILQPYEVTPFKHCRRYIAVSYCCAPPWKERKSSGGYVVRDSEGSRDSRVRDTVLDRVTRFCIIKNTPIFWIDNECIAPSEKSAAISAMDIVYRYSWKTIGLISTRINSYVAISRLDHLLQQNYVVCHPTTNTVTLADSIGPRLVRRVLQLLRRITADPWWHRCWTFQEEYLSGDKMLLLIPTPHLSLDETSFTRLDIVAGEVAFYATNFRRQVTLFCIAVWNDERVGDRVLRSWCRTILHRARSYTVLHQYQGSVRRKIGVKAMSPSLYADLSRRDLTELKELPSLLTNCCGYTKRVVWDNVKYQASISLILLAWFLTNGELLNHRCRGGNCMSETVVTFLARHAFERLRPPTSRHELTFAKRCRIPHVVLSHDGIRTRGHLWRVVAAIRVAKEPSPRHFRQYVSKRPFKPFQRARLCQMVTQLQEKYPHLSSCLHEWILETSQVELGKDQRMKMMVDMATALCRAIKKGRRILVALSGCSDTHGALFAASGRNEGCPERIFTSWNCGEIFVETESTRAVENYVSLQVTGDWTCVAPRWIPHGWINGLCFFAGLPQEDILFSWPRCFEDN